MEGAIPVDGHYVSKRPEFISERYLETGINDAGTGYLGFDVQDVAQETVGLRMNGRFRAAMATVTIRRAGVDSSRLPSRGSRTNRRA